MADRELRCETVGDVEVLTLDRPGARNALTHTTYRELEQAVRATSARCLEGVASFLERREPHFVGR